MGVTSADSLLIYRYNLRKLTRWGKRIVSVQQEDIVKRMIIIAVLLFGVFGFAQAQSTVPVFCGDMAEADCDIVRQNQQAMLELESAAFELDLDFTIANIPDMPGNVSFSLTGDGEVVGNTSALTTTPDEMLALMADSQAYADFVESMLEAVAVDVSLVLNLPQALVEETGGEIPASIPLDIVLTDGIAYLNFTTLRDALGEMGESFPMGWYGIDLGGLMQQVVAMSDTMGSMGSVNSAMDPELLSKFTDPDFLSSFMSIERLEDSTAADGSAVAVFHSILDYQAMMNDPAMRDLMLQSVEAQGLELDSDEMAEFEMIMSNMFNGLTLDIVTTIGLDDFYSRDTQVSMHFDMSTLMAMAEEMGEDVELDGPAPTLSFSMNITQSRFNEIASIAAPTNATVIPLESLGLGGMNAPASSSFEMQPTATPAS